MKTIYQTSIQSLLLLVISLFFGHNLTAQYCDSTVPSFNVDLSASPNYNWISPLVQRNGNCCGTTNPDNCLEFIITLHPSAVAVSFNIASGAIPPGALFYQVDCGPQTPVGEPICLDGAGPHHLTFCKPGNNENSFSIISYSDPIIGPDITLNAGCSGFIYGNYYDETTVNWTSIAPGAVGSYDNLLSCTSGCDTTYITAPVAAPAYVDYLVCGMDIGGCNPNPICDTVRVHFIDPVTVNLTSVDAFLCAGFTTTITASASGGSAPYSYLWSTGATGSSIVAGPGTYYIEVIDTSACYTATDTIVVTQYAIPPVTAGPDQIACAGSSVTLIATGADSYVWDNGVTNGIPFGQGVGTSIYTVIGTDANGCENTDQVSVTINPLPIVSAGPNQIICEGGSVTLNGAGAMNYVWDNGVQDGVAFNQGVGTITYSVIGTDMNGCSSNDQVDVSVNPLPTVSAGQDQVICEGEAVTLNGAGTQSYLWDNGVSNGIAFTPSSGVVTYTVTGTDINGCTDTDQVIVFVNALPLVDAGTDQVVCEGTSVTLTATGAYDYFWNNGVTNGVSFVQGVGVVNYSVIGTDLNGCSNTDYVQVIVNPNPDVNAGLDQTACEGTSITLSANGSQNMYWENGVINNIPFTQGVGLETYIVHDSLSTGCTDEDTVTVEIFANPIILTQDDEICEGEGVILSAQGALSYSWTGGVWNGVVFYPTTSGSYTVTGTSAEGCTTEAEAIVIVHDSPLAAFEIDDISLTTLDPTTGFTNLSSGATSFEWDFGDGSANSYEFEPAHTFPTEESGEYAITLTVTTDFGCTSEAIKYVHVFQDYTVFVPNSFTPDGDGVNDFFFPALTGFNEDDYTMYIFNRWGDLIFESHDMHVGWDGKFTTTNQVQDGAYTWKIVAGLKDSTDSKIFVGHVILLK